MFIFFNNFFLTIFSFLFFFFYFIGSSTEALISRWTFIRYIIVGLYVGAATVGIFVMWYAPTSFGIEVGSNNEMSFLGVEFGSDQHPTMTYVRVFTKCSIVEKVKKMFLDSQFLDFWVIKPSPINRL